MSDNKGPNKRRRLNNYGLSSVHKPFKSPMRTPLAPKQPNGQSPLISNEVAAAKSSPIKANSVIPPLPGLQSLPRNSQSSPIKASSSRPFHPPTQANDPEERLLKASIRETRSEIEILKQALAILTSSKPDRLSGLIAEWKQVTRLAAEEVFDQSRERVERMGGLKVWKTIQAQSLAAWSQDDDASRSTLQVNSDDAEQPQDNDADHEEFTMEMMLRSMNADLQLVGYDPTLQTWTH